jgi:thiol-disulfide isomerase/thioredoxin
MDENNNADNTHYPKQGIGKLLLYSLVAALAAIAGFLSVILADRLTGPDPSRRVQATQINAANSAATSERSHGLEKLVRSDSPKPLPAIRFSDGEGRERSLSEWRGKIVLVNLWATWCAPCRVEMPSLDRLQAKLGGPDFAVVPISLDWGGPDKPRQYLETNKLSNLPLYVDSFKTLMQSLNVPGLPLSVLIDREGRELARLAGAAEWDSPEAEAIIRAAMSGEGAI